MSARTRRRDMAKRTAASSTVMIFPFILWDYKAFLFAFKNNLIEKQFFFPYIFGAQKDEGRKFALPAFE